MDNNRSGIAKGCLGIVIVAAFFIGVPIIVYFTFFGPEGETSSAYWVTKSEEAYVAEDFELALLWADSALEIDEGIEGYAAKLKAAHALGNSQATEEVTRAVPQLEFDAEVENELYNMIPYMHTTGQDYSAEPILTYWAQNASEEDILAISERLAEEGILFEALFLEAAVEVYPEDLEMNMALGASYRTLGENDLAIAVYEFVIKRNPINDVALNNLGYCYYMKSENSRAREYFSRAAELGNESAERNLDRLKATNSK